MLKGPDISKQKINPLQQICGSYSAKISIVMSLINDYFTEFHVLFLWFFNSIPDIAKSGITLNQI